MNALIRMPNRIERFVRLPQAGEGGQVRLISIEGDHEPFHRQAVSRLCREGCRRISRHPRLRSGNPRRSRRSGAAVRDRAQAPPPRHRDPARHRGDDAGGVAALRATRARRLRRQRVQRRRRARAQRDGADREPQPAGSRIRAVYAALSRPRPRPWRRLLCRDPAEGFHHPPPLRVVRRGGEFPAAGGARSRRRRDQADALSHLGRIPRSSRRSRKPPKPANRSPRWSSSRPASTRKPISAGRAISNAPACRSCSVSSS